MSYTLLKVGRFPMPEKLKSSLLAFGDFYVDHELSETERAEVRARADIVVASGGSEFTRKDFESTPNLKAVVCFSVGYDKIDVAAAIDHGVIVTNTPQVLDDDVANTAMMLLLSTTRRLYATQKYVQEGQWGKKPLSLTDSITKKNLGIVGLGRIGHEIAARASACKMNIAYYGHRRKTDVAYDFYENLMDLAKWADVLMISCPASDETYHMIDAKVLEALGPTGYLINIARGSIVNTKDLIHALDNNIIAGAGLDVFEHEPNIEVELLNRDNVALLPHVGSATHETRAQMASLVIQNIEQILKGGTPLTPLPGTWPTK